LAQQNMPPAPFVLSSSGTDSPVMLMCPFATCGPAQLSSTVLAQPPPWFESLFGCFFCSLGRHFHRHCVSHVLHQLDVPKCQACFVVLHTGASTSIDRRRPWSPLRPCMHGPRGAGLLGGRVTTRLLAPRGTDYQRDRWAIMEAGAVCLVHS
jgi:hypothetical protein